MVHAVREIWDAKRSSLENNLSSTLGCTWWIKVDAEALYQVAEERNAKENPGDVIGE